MNDDITGRPTRPNSAQQHQGANHDPGGIVRRGLPIYFALLLGIATVAFIILLIELRHVLVLLFISLLFASAASRPAGWLSRFRVPLGIAVLLVYLGVLALFALIVALVLPPLLGQIAEFSDNLPEYVARYERLRLEYEDLRSEYPGLQPFESQATDAGSRIIDGIASWAVDLPGKVFTGFLDLLSVLIISSLLVTSRVNLIHFTLSLVHPSDRDEWARIIDKIWDRLGYYIRAKLIVMVIVGAITYVALLVIGVPYAVPLAVVVALGELIPRIGPWLARIPLLGIALLQGWLIFALTFGASIVIENLKGSVISPFVEGDQLNIHPLLVFVSVLTGSALLGVAGAFISVPAAAMIQVLFEELIIPWRQRQLGASVSSEVSALSTANVPPSQEVPEES